MPLRLGHIMRSRIVRAAAGSSGLRAAMIVLTLATSVLLARLLGPAGFGVYAFALSVVTLAGLPVQMGVPVVVLRETAKTGAVEDWSRMRGVWDWAGRRVAISAMIVVPCIAVAAWIAQPWLIPDGGLPVLWVGLALIPLIAAARMRGSALRGLHHPVLGQVPETVIRPGGLFALVSALAALGVVVTPALAMGMHVVASCLAFGIGAWVLMRLAPPGLKTATPDKSDAAQWRKAIVPLALISGMQILMQNVSVLLLGVWRLPEEIGWFRIAMAAATLVLFGLTIANQIVAPRIAALNAKDDRDGMARQARISAGLSLLAATPIALVLLVFGKDVLALLYGDAFRPAYAALVWLVLAQLVNAFFGSCVSLLNMSGHERKTARALIIAALVNAALCVALIPSLGGVGAGIATLCSTILWNVLMEMAVRNHLGFSSTPLGLLSHRKTGGRA